MRLLLRLAYRNLAGAKLRTWLNVAVLSVIYVMVVCHMSIFDGLNQQAARSVIEQYAGDGQYWSPGYDPEDPLHEGEMSASVPAGLASEVAAGRATAILVEQAAIYPSGRMVPVTLRGIDPRQKVLDFPGAAALATPPPAVAPTATGSSSRFDEDGAFVRSTSAASDEVPILVGPGMAQSKSLSVGDTFLIRWRDVRGTFDAVDGRVVAIMETAVPAIDSGQVWLPIDRLRRMLGAIDRASYVVVADRANHPAAAGGWTFKERATLLADIDAAVAQKRAGSIVMYVILLLLVLLAIFDAQVLSIVRRRKEIGTVLALGLTRRRVVALYTLEGSLNCVLALGAGAIYGVPLWLLTWVKGIPMRRLSRASTLPIPEHVFPEYSVRVIIGTALVMLAAVVLVSFWPSRRIARLQPTEALRGAGK